MKVIKTYRIEGLKKKEKQKKTSARGLKIFFSNLGNYQRAKIPFLINYTYTYPKYFSYTFFFHVTTGCYVSDI